jgi:hypothetical protein
MSILKFGMRAKIFPELLRVGTFIPNEGVSSADVDVPCAILWLVNRRGKWPVLQKSVSERV